MDFFVLKFGCLSIQSPIRTGKLSSRGIHTSVRTVEKRSPGFVFSRTCGFRVDFPAADKIENRIFLHHDVDM